MVDVEDGRLGHLQGAAALNRGELGVLAPYGVVLDARLTAQCHGALAVHGDARRIDMVPTGVRRLESHRDAVIHIDSVVVPGDVQAGPLARLAASTDLPGCRDVDRAVH
ncbi:hypothetical protein D3C81_1949190 [compost metagenome]